MTRAGSRVVVTGMGCVTAAGFGVGALWRAASRGETGVGEIEPEARGSRISFAARVPGFDDGDLSSARPAEKHDRFAALALAAADEALLSAGLVEHGLGDSCGVVVGSGIGGATTSANGHQAYYTSGARLDPMTIPKVMPNAAASLISMRYGARGPCLCVSTACASGAQAIGLGAGLIRSGTIDYAVVGGAEALLTPPIMRAWELLRVLTPTLCRPFSKGRDGMVLGEGAAILVLESLRSAEARGAAILGELAGFGTSSDANDLLRPDPAGAARAMSAALVDAGLTSEDVGYVNAHGTGTVLNDAAESEALARVFGGRLQEVAVSSTKPVHGHAMGAAGAIECVVTLMALREQLAPPTINWLGDDPKCPIDSVPNAARPLATECAMSNSFAFGGINGVLVLRRFH